jgi:hypothetical protein
MTDLEWTPDCRNKNCPKKEFIHSINYCKPENIKKQEEFEKWIRSDEGPSMTKKERLNWPPKCQDVDCRMREINHAKGEDCLLDPEENWRTYVYIHPTNEQLEALGRGDLIGKMKCFELNCPRRGISHAQEESCQQRVETNKLL